jgi:hypothetical protein
MTVSTAELPLTYLETLFSDFAPGEALLREVSGFYGSKFFIRRNDVPSGESRYTIDSGGEKAIFQHATISLNTTTNRVCAAAVHELLHLRQPIRGFPLVRSLALDPFHHQQAAYIDDALAKTVNVLDHDIFVSDFVESGLSIAEFVSTNEAVAPSYRNLSKRWKRDLGSAATGTGLEWIPWSSWALEFLRHKLPAKYGIPKEAEFAAGAKKWGATCLSGFGEIADQIETWILAARHHQSTSYGAALSDLLFLMKLPQIESLVLLKACGAEGPRVQIVRP